MLNPTILALLLLPCLLLTPARSDDKGTPPPAEKVAPKLPLGKDTPEEIAISIVAELVAARHGGSGASMSVVEQALASAASDDESTDEA